MVEVNFPEWASTVTLRKTEKGKWSAALVCTDFAGYEAEVSEGNSSPQEAIDNAAKQFDFDSLYWKAKRGES